jgi:hypothetical protein
MLLCASNDAHDAVEPLDPPAEAPVGERVWFGSEQLQVGLTALLPSGVVIDGDPSGVVIDAPCGVTCTMQSLAPLAWLVGIKQERWCGTMGGSN